MNGTLIEDRIARAMHRAELAKAHALDVPVHPHMLTVDERWKMVSNLSLAKLNYECAAAAISEALGHIR